MTYGEVSFDQFASILTPNCICLLTNSSRKERDRRCDAGIISDKVREETGLLIVVLNLVRTENSRRL
ncbi:hypothetical protein BCR33DRAFT_711283, partial [Rhizoclosmatium globosum]